MFNPRGNLPPRPRGPNAPGPIPRGPFQGPESGSGGLQRQPPHGMAQRFVGSDMRAGFPGPNVQVTQHRMDPRQARERINMERQQKEEGHATHWDNPFAPGNSSRSQPASGRIAEHTTSVQSRYTNESASSILASFGLSNDDLEELSRYPDDQLTPENMPLILRDIRMHKMTRRLPSLPSQSREKETFSKDDGRGSMVKSKVIDYGHESKYGYTESPLDVKVYNSDVSAEKSMKGFQAQETAPVTATPPSIPSTTLNAVEELIRQMGFQRSTPNTQLFPPMDIVNKVPGLCLSSAGPVVPPAVQPMMPPVVSTMPQPVMPPVAQQALPPPPVAQPMMPTMNQPPPPFAPEMLEAINRHGRIQCESRGGKLPNPPPRPTGSQKNFQKESENPIESPFGVVKASWLPVFSQADAQKMKRLPTPSMMNDYYAASPRIFPHMCSLCNVECRHLKDWIQHQNSTAHIESCRQLRQQYPDWNPEAHSSYKRREGVRKENHGVRRRSASPSPKRSRRSSSGHARRRTRSRSRSRSPGRLRAARPRSRSPRRLPSPRRRSRSPRRCQDSSLWSRRSCSRERGLGRSARSPDEALEAAVKCLGPSFVKQFNKQEQFNKQFSKQEQFNKQEQISKQKSFQVLGRETSGTKRTLPELGKAPGSVKKTPSNPVGPLKPSKMDLHSHSVSSKPVEAAETKESNQGGMVADEKSGKLPSGAPTKETSAGPPVPYNRLLTEKLLNLKLLKCGTVLRMSDLPYDYSYDDIKKIVEPFGKVSDLLVLRSTNEAFLEMNYKEAAIAAVKYSNTVPVLVNGRRVKIGIAEKPRASPSQNKGNGKKATKNVKKPPLNTKKDETNSVEKMKKPAAPITSTSKTNIKKPGEPPKGAEGEPADAKKPEEAKKALESKKTTEPKKVVESNAKEMPRPAQETEKVPGATEAVKSTEAGESVKAEVTKKEVRKLEPTKERHEGDQNENCTQRQRSISPSPEQVSCSSSGHARRLTRLPSRSPGRHPSAGRVRGNSSSRSQRSSSKESPRHRTRSPQKSRHSSSRSQRSSSKESSRHRTRSPQKSQNSSSRSQRSSSKESSRHRTRSPQKCRHSSSSRTSEDQWSTQSTRRYKKKEKRRGKSAHRKKCRSEQQTKDEATSQERPSSEVLQGKQQPHDDSKHMAALTPLTEKSVLQAMSLLQAGGASGVGPLAARNLDLAAVPPDVVSMIQLVATQVVQAVLTSKTSLRMQGSGDMAAALGPGATTCVSSETEEREEKHELLPGPEGVMVAAPGPEASAAGPGPRVTTCASSKAEKQELVTCSEGADVAAPGPEASAAALDTEANISVSSEAEKQELVPSPGVNSDPLGSDASVAALGPEAGISVSSEAEKQEDKQELVPSPEDADVAAPGPEASAAALDSEANISVSSEAEKQELVPSPGVNSDTPGSDASVAALGPEASISVSSEAEKQELVPSPVAAFQPKQLWICGHSGVQMARESAAKSGKGDQLGLSDQLNIKWLSQHGMEWSELVPMLEKEAASSDSPDVLVLQLGDNDLFKIDDDYFITLAKKDLEWCLLRFPGVRIIWSVLLPFPGWKSLIKYNLLDKRRKRVNNLVGSFLKSRGGNVITHSDITPKHSEAYSENGLCLSEKGADIWLRNICNGLVRMLQLSPPQGMKLRKRKQGLQTLPAEAPGTS